MKWQRHIATAVFAVLAIAALVFVLLARAKSYERLHASFYDIAKKDHFAFRYAQKLLPEDASDINCSIRFPGGKFKLSFAQTEAGFEKYLERFELVRCAKIDRPTTADDIEHICTINEGHKFEALYRTGSSKLKTSGLFDRKRCRTMIECAGFDASGN